MKEKGKSKESYYKEKSDYLEAALTGIKMNTMNSECHIHKNRTNRLKI